MIGFVKAVVDMFRHPFYFPANTILLVMAALLIGSMALLADLIVRSRGDDRGDPGFADPREAKGRDGQRHEPYPPVGY